MWFMGPFYSNPGSQTARGFRRQPLYQEPPFSPRKGRLFARGLRPVPPLPCPPSRSFPNRAEQNCHTWSDRRWAGHTARLRRGGPVMRRRPVLSRTAEGSIAGERMVDDVPPGAVLLLPDNLRGARRHLHRFPVRPGPGPFPPPLHPRDSVHAHAVEVPACHTPFERETPERDLA